MWWCDRSTFIYTLKGDSQKREVCVRSTSINGVQQRCRSLNAQHIVADRRRDGVVHIVDTANTVRTGSGAELRLGAPQTLYAVGQGDAPYFRIGINGVDNRVAHRLEQNPQDPNHFFFTSEDRDHSGYGQLGDPGDGNWDDARRYLMIETRNRFRSSEAITPRSMTWHAHDMRAYQNPRTNALDLLLAQEGRNLLHYDGASDVWSRLRLNFAYDLAVLPGRPQWLIATAEIQRSPNHIFDFCPRLSEEPSPYPGILAKFSENPAEPWQSLFGRELAIRSVDYDTQNDVLYFAAVDVQDARMRAPHPSNFPDLPASRWRKANGVFRVDGFRAWLHAQQRQAKPVTRVRVSPYPNGEGWNVIWPSVANARWYEVYELVQTRPLRSPLDPRLAYKRVATVGQSATYRNWTRTGLRRSEAGIYYYKVRACSGIACSSFRTAGQIDARD